VIIETRKSKKRVESTHIMSGNEFGIIKKSVSFQHVTAKSLEIEGGNDKQVLDLYLACDIDKKNIKQTIALVDKDGNKAVIPEGCVINKVTVSAVDYNGTSADFAAVVGYIAEEVTEEANVNVLAQRVFNNANPITAAQLNIIGSASVCQVLKGDNLAAHFVNCGIATGKDFESLKLNGCVQTGEPLALNPVMTGINGTCKKGALCVTFTIAA
jgi:hypothetical protein